ncbi:MAG: ribosome recycling factor [Clostridia bacterium]|nr:ribosome recycling factor [Clostridia bacterium]
MQNVINAAKEKMEKSMDALERELGTIRAGRANPKVLDRISVDYYGSPTPINQMAAVSVPDPKTILIQPWDASQLKAIEQAIQASDIGINPQNDGRAIRLSFPQPTEERRKELVKEAKKVGEDSKVAVRSVRRDAIDKIKAMKKNSEITEDEVALGEKKMQELTDKYCKEIDGVISAKETEILAI